MRSYQTALEDSRELSESAKRGHELFFADRIAARPATPEPTSPMNSTTTWELAWRPKARLGSLRGDEKRCRQRRVQDANSAQRGPLAPYMHDGSQETLEEVMEWYDKGGHPNPFLSDKIKKLDLTEQEEEDLIAFMKEALTSAFPDVCRDRLPE